MSFYGFWLPNDPRGSWSDFVRSYELYRAGGRATKIDERHSVANRRRDPTWKRDTESALKFDPVRLNGRQALAIANGFARGIEERSYIILACAILPDHVHLVIFRSGILAEQMMRHLKSKATMEIRKQGLHPFDGDEFVGRKCPPLWTRNAWKVYLDFEEDVQRAVEYVEMNPVKDGLPKQHWSFVKPV